MFPSNLPRGLDLLSRAVFYGAAMRSASMRPHLCTMPDIRSRTHYTQVQYIPADFGTKILGE
jgi:hypothetical protein